MSVPENLTRELARLISCFGAANVLDECKRLCKKTAGNKTKPDWQHLMEGFEKDARGWLQGREPIKESSNYSIAKAFADRFPGFRKESTHKRIARKLKKERERAILVGALWIAESECSFERFFQVAEESAKLAPNVKAFAAFRLIDLEQYRDVFGEPPHDMTIAEISKRLKNVPASPPVNVLQTLARRSKVHRDMTPLD